MVAVFRVSPKSIAGASLRSNLFPLAIQYGALIADPAEKVVQKSVISPLPEVLTLKKNKKSLKTAIQQRTAAKNPMRAPTHWFRFYCPLQSKKVNVFQ
jgi:integrase/recombinase XerD